MSHEIVHVFKTSVLGIGITNPEGLAVPTITLSFPDETLREIVVDYLGEADVSEHAMVSFAVNDRGCEICVVILMPVEAGFVFVGGLNTFPVEQTGAFLDARRNQPEYIVALAKLPDEPIGGMTSLNAAWYCELSETMTPEAMSERCAEIIQTKLLMSMFMDNAEPSPN